MKKELCFILNDEHLYLDAELINFNDIPIFYICKTNSNYYLSLCTDIDNAKYILIEISPINILKMLYQQISMRELYEKVDKFWEVECGEVPELDEIYEKEIYDIDLSVLPIEDERYEIFDDIIKKYREDLQLALLQKTFFTLFETKNFFVDNYNVLFERSFKPYQQAIKDLFSQKPKVTLKPQNYELKNEVVRTDITFNKNGYTSIVENTNDAA